MLTLFLRTFLSIACLLVAASSSCVINIWLLHNPYPSAKDKHCPHFIIIVIIVIISSSLYLLSIDHLRRIACTVVPNDNNNNHNHNNENNNNNNKFIRSAKIYFLWKQRQSWSRYSSSQTLHKSWKVITVRFNRAKLLKWWWLSMMIWETSDLSFICSLIHFKLTVIFFNECKLLLLVFYDRKN